MAKAKAKVKSKAKSKAKPKPAVKAKAKPKSKPVVKAKVKAKVKAEAKKTTQPVQSSKAKPAKATSAYNFKFRPLDDRILVKVKAGEKKTPGGLYIPDTSSMTGHFEGEVLAVGPGHRSKKGNIRPLDVKVGDLILFSQFTGTELKEMGEELRLLRESEILGLVD